MNKNNENNSARYYDEIYGDAQIYEDAYLIGVPSHIDITTMHETDQFHALHDKKLKMIGFILSLIILCLIILVIYHFYS